jgi:hypothetical protein
MYRIKVRNDQTGVIFYEYGFSKWMMKRIHFLFNETDNDFYSVYNILEITILEKNIKTFIKCLTNKTKVL